MATLPRTVLPAANAPSSVIRNQVPNSFASEIARHTKVLVEIGPERGQPGKCPSHAMLEGFDFCEGRARDSSEHRVARGEMHEAARQVVDHIRAGGTALVVPIRRETEHEVIDDELSLLAE